MIFSQPGCACYVKTTFPLDFFSFFRHQQEEPNGPALDWPAAPGRTCEVSSLRNDGWARRATTEIGNDPFRIKIGINGKLQ